MFLTVGHLRYEVGSYVFYVGKGHEKAAIEACKNSENTHASLFRLANFVVDKENNHLTKCRVDLVDIFDEAFDIVEPEPFMDTLTNPCYEEDSLQMIEQLLEDFEILTSDLPKSEEEYEGLPPHKQIDAQNSTATAEGVDRLLAYYLTHEDYLRFLEYVGLDYKNTIQYEINGEL